MEEINLNSLKYPLDTKYLLRYKRKIKNEIIKRKSNFLIKRIAILGGSTTNEIVDQLELFLLEQGIKPEFYQSGFNQYWTDAMFGNKDLDSFKPEIVIIHTTWHNINVFPSVLDDEKVVNKKINDIYNHFFVMWEKLFSKYNCIIIQNNFDRPNYRLLGNRDVWDYRGKTNFISNLNNRFYQYAQKKQGFFINDIDYLSSDFGISSWNDEVYWSMYKYAMNLNAVPIVAFNLSNIIKSVYGFNKKLIALDLDNTLWGGIIGDDGIEGISLGPETPTGQLYSDFQKYCKELKDIGIVLAINSKNEESNALLGLSHPDSILSRDDFVSIKANWNPKNVNLICIANELNLGTDSFVFIDDNPVERDIVANSVNCSVINADKVENFIKLVDHSGLFECTTLTKEDAEKTTLYATKAKAANEILKFDSYDDYLKSLNMKATIRPFEKIYIQRISQLTNKSNQFNLTTLRCSEEDIKLMSEDDNYITLYGKLEDKFGDNGLISVISGKKENNELHIKLWLMSCRVLKRGMEYVMMNKLFDIAKEQNIEKIYGYYYPSQKNGMVKDFYKEFGFSIVHSSEKESVWYILVDKYKYKKNYIDLI